MYNLVLKNPLEIFFWFLLENFYFKLLQDFNTNFLRLLKHF